MGVDPTLIDHTSLKEKGESGTTDACNLIDDVKNVHPHNRPLDFICCSDVAQSEIISYSQHTHSFETKKQVLHASSLCSFLVVVHAKNVNETY